MESMTARERILDAAARIMRERGIAHATTKEIARSAECSEALLYKNFPSKQVLFMAVLGERLPRPFDATVPGESTVRDNLVASTAALVAFYRESFPIAASLFSERELLAAWRDGMAAAGGGPRTPGRALAAYLEGEKALGRLPNAIDSHAVASLLVGAALQEAFLLSFEDREVTDATTLAATWIEAIAF
jgi:AcrR family transcriptional regulator